MEAICRFFLLDLLLLAAMGAAAEFSGRDMCHAGNWEKEIHSNKVDVGACYRCSQPFR
jgi:hypothetical protein